MHTIHFSFTHHKYNFRCLRGCLTNKGILFLICLLLSLWRIEVTTAQSTCLSFFQFAHTPPVLPSGAINFSICDLRSTADLTIAHEYSSDHDFLITITVPDQFLYIETTPALTNESQGTDPFGNTVITGTYTAHYNNPSLSVSNLLIHFERLSNWIDDAQLEISYTITDESCNPPASQNFDPTLYCNIYSDLRSAPSNLVSQLVSSQWLKECEPGIAGEVLIDDELIIDMDYCFDNPLSQNLTIALLPGAKITVQSSNTLDLTKMNILTCGTELAQGIIIESGATLIMDGCDVSDSRFGIDARAGSTLSVTNTDFADNYIGVRFDMAGAPNRVTIDAFNGNHFFTDDGVKTPFAGMPEQVETRGYCGIYVNNYRDFNIWGDNPTGPNLITFNSLANGIVGYNSYGNLGNMTFSDMNSVDAQKKSTSKDLVSVCKAREHIGSTSTSSGQQ